MNYHLVMAGEGRLLASRSAVIPASERVAFTDAVALLRAAQAIRARAEAEVARARDDARAEGLAEASAAVDALLADRIVAFAEAIDAHEAARRADIAAAALAALRAIVGTLEDERIVAGIVDQTLARLPEAAAVRLFVAPSLAAAIARRLERCEHVTVQADATLGQHDCVLRTAAGQVIASLSVQLDALARRWGVARADEGGEGTA